MLYFLLMFPRTKSNVVLLWVPLVPMNPLSNFGTFPPFMSVMYQDLALRHGVPQLHTPSADLQTFLINTLSPLRILFPFQSHVVNGSCYCTNVLSVVLFQFLVFIS
jgi:hypothetical protein